MVKKIKLPKSLNVEDPSSLPDSSELVYEVYTKDNPNKKYRVKASKKKYNVVVQQHWLLTTVLIITALIPLISSTVYPLIKKKFKN